MQLVAAGVVPPRLQQRLNVRRVHVRRLRVLGLILLTHGQCSGAGAMGFGFPMPKRHAVVQCGVRSICANAPLDCSRHGADLSQDLPSIRTIVHELRGTNLAPCIRQLSQQIGLRLCPALGVQPRFGSQMVAVATAPEYVDCPERRQGGSHEKIRPGEAKR